MLNLMADNRFLFHDSLLFKSSCFTFNPRILLYLAKKLRRKYSYESFPTGDYSKFAINSSTGWITLGPGQILDRDSADMSSNGGVFAMYVQVCTR